MKDIKAMELEAYRSKLKRMQDIQNTYVNAKEAIQSMYISDMKTIQALEIEQRESNK